MRHILFVTAVAWMIGSPAFASPCTALATFFVKVVEASEAKVAKNVLAEQTATFRKDEKACARAVARLEDAEKYSASVGKPVSLLQGYLVPEAEFSVEVIRSGDHIEAIEFNIDQIGALRKRPAR